MEHNLFSKSGSHPLNYPHYTKWDDKKGLVYIVTNPDTLVQEGDEIFVGFEQKSAYGPVFTYLHKRAIVTSVIEQRSARGVHDRPFKPTFQLVSVL